MGVAVTVIEGDRRDAVVLAAIVLIGTLLQGALGVERAIITAVRAGHVRHARSTVRLAMVMGAMTALAVGIAVLGVHAALGTQDFATAIGQTQGAGVPT